MEGRIANILRVAIFLMVLTVWLPTAAVLAVPHENDWVEHYIVTADIKTKCEARRRGDRNCRKWSPIYAEIEWDGWIVLGPINLALLAGLYFVSGSLSLRPERNQETSDEASKDDDI